MPQSPARQNGPAGNPQSPTVSRDPRRVAAQSSTGHQKVATSFHELVSQISNTVAAEAEKQRVTKRRRLDDEDRAKAEQRQFQFPAALAQNRATSATHDNDFRLAQSNLSKSQNRQKQLSENLVSTLCRVTESNMLNHIKTDIDATTAQANRAETASNNLKEELGELKAIGPTVTRLESDNKEIRSELSTFNNSLSEAKSSVEHVVTSMPPPCNHEETIRKLEEKLKLNQEATEQQIEELRRDMSSQKDVNDATASTCSSLENRVTSLSAGQAPATADSTSTLHADFRILSDRFSGLLDEQERRDNILTEELGNTQASVQQLEKSMKELSETATGLRKEIADLQHPPSSNIAQTPVEVSKPQMPSTEIQQQQPQNVDGRLQSIRNELSRYDSSLNALNVAVHSLQTRCNNMTSEPIVRQMANAMRTMYPYADNAQKSIESFQGTLNGFVERMNSLNSRLETAEQAQTQAKAERELFIKDMNAEKDRVVQELRSHGTRITAIEASNVDVKEQRRLSLERVASAEDRLTSEMKTLKADMGNMEDYTSTELASVLDKLRKAEECLLKVPAMEREMNDIGETIRRHSAKAMQEMEDRGREGQVLEERNFEDRENGYSAHKHLPRETSESSRGSKAGSPQDIPTGPESLPSRPPTNPTVWGRHIPTSQMTRPSKKRKKNTDLNLRVSRD